MVNPRSLPPITTRPETGASERSAARVRAGGAGRRRRALLRQVADVVGVAVLVGGALTVLTAHRQGVLVTFVVFSAMGVCFATAYVVAVRVVVDRWHSRARRAWQRLALHLSAVALATVVGGEAATRVVAVLGGRVNRLRVMGVGLGVLGAIRLIEVGYERLRRQVREVELREERTRRQALLAELASIQSRTDPHFLFNSLNTVAGLIEEDPRRAVEVITRLASFLRHSLQASRGTSIGLGEELRAVSTFLEIQALRLDHRLEWTCEAEPGLERVPVPPFLLQPLVENAVTHAAASRNRPTRIEVRASRRRDRLQLSVADDGPGPGASPHVGAGTSLADLAERLELLFGARAHLETGRGRLGGFMARVELPVGDPVEEVRT